jgi:hypothetical protein
MRVPRSWLLLQGILALTVLPAEARAQAAGSEFQVNTYTTSAQFLPSIASDASGNFVVVWTSTDQDGSGRGVFGQRFDSEGDPQGGEFRVNSYTTGSQHLASVASDANGDFVVVWEGSSSQDGNASGIFGKRFDSAGNTLGTEFRVNSYTTQGQYDPSVASDASGNFVVVWEGRGQGGSGVFGQRYDSSGGALGSEFAVAFINAQADPSIASDSSGNFVVVWTGRVVDILGQRFDSGGVPQGSEFLVSSYTTYNQGSPAVASDPSGNFVVVWSGTGPDDAPFGIFAQRYDNTGEPLGTQFRVNSYTTSSQARPSVASDESGNSFVVWQSDQDDPFPEPSWGVYGQRYDSEGTAQGSEFRVNTFTTSYQQFPSVASTGADKFVVTWGSGGQDGDSDGVFGQRFDFGGASTIHTGDLDARAKDVGVSWRAQVNVLVHADGHAPESGVLVTLDVSPGMGTQTCTTTASGVCEVSVVVADAVPSLRFTVTSLSKSGFGYDAGANHDPDADSDGTTIVIDRPRNVAGPGATRVGRRPGYSGPGSGRAR